MKHTGSLFVAAMLLFLGFFIQPTDGQAWHGGKMATVRVMTFNIHAGIGSDGQYDIARIADAIAQADADVVLRKWMSIGGNAAHMKMKSSGLPNGFTCTRFLPPFTHWPSIGPDNRPGNTASPC
jgi:hypothetical protein